MQHFIHVRDFVELKPVKISDAEAIVQHKKIKALITIAEKVNRVTQKQCAKKNTRLTINSDWNEFPDGWSDKGHKEIFGNKPLIDLILRKIKLECEHWLAKGNTGIPPIVSKYYDCTGSPCPAIQSWYNGF